MKVQIAVIAIAILATILIATPTIFSNSMVNTAFAKTTHEYCYRVSAVFGDHGRCFSTLAACQQDEAKFTEANPAYYRGKDCSKVTNSDKSTTNYCFDLIVDGSACYNGKKECETKRVDFLASYNGYRVGSEPCYKL